MAVLIISLLLTVTSFALLAISLFSKQITERTAIGSGGQLALGYLYSISKPDMELAYAKRHARKAVEIAAVLDSNTNKPLQLVVQERM
jgi:20S proteasome alpha/beta subunit